MSTHPLTLSDNSATSLLNVLCVLLRRAIVLQQQHCCLQLFQIDRNDLFINNNGHKLSTQKLAGKLQQHRKFSCGCLQQIRQPQKRGLHHDAQPGDKELSGVMKGTSDVTSATRSTVKTYHHLSFQYVLNSTAFLSLRQIVAIYKDTPQPLLLSLIFDAWTSCRYYQKLRQRSLCKKLWLRYNIVRQK